MWCVRSWFQASKQVSFKTRARFLVVWYGDCSYRHHNERALQIIKEENLVLVVLAWWDFFVISG